MEWGLDLQSEHERYLTEQEFGGTPLFVTDYPKNIKVCATLPQLHCAASHLVRVADLGSDRPSTCG